VDEITASPSFSFSLHISLRARMYVLAVYHAEEEEEEENRRIDVCASDWHGQAHIFIESDLFLQIE
jgi:hypothetical protein